MENKTYFRKGLTMEKIVWVIDEILLERHDEFGFPNMQDSAKEAGHEVYVTKYIPFSEFPDFNLRKYRDETIYKPIVFYGSIQFINQLNRHGYLKKAVPGAYYNLEQLKYSYYSGFFGELMLNDDYVILPYSEVARRAKSIFGDRFFIRPDVVTKPFAGRPVDFSTLEDDPKALGQYNNIYPNDLCVVASKKEIKGEYRHVICNHELIAQSQYQWEGKLDIRIDVHPECQRLAKEVSRNEWQPDYVYVVDTALLPSGEARIIEFNTFSCSGLYACDTRAIIKHVSEMAVKEFNGDV
jgi:hypothetical protein